ncbi:hypothetical protein P3679_24270, partial [Vibrio parahaemolyticus]|uniref:hypothetical protein n=2 Tax=Vibrio TaxID=662 RepID=UPI001BB04D57
KGNHEVSNNDSKSKEEASQASAHHPFGCADPYPFQLKFMSDLGIFLVAFRLGKSLPFRAALRCE